MIAFFHATLYQPLYNGLVLLIGIMPGADVGLAVLVLTVLVKIIIFPLSEKAVSTQLLMKLYEPELNELKLKYKNEKEKQAQAVLAFYREHKINPFSSFLVLLIQMPIIISLYYVFYGGGLPVINLDLIYSFVKVPSEVNMLFLGLLDIGSKSLLFAILVSVTQFYQMKLSVPALPPRDKNDKKPASMKDELARSMNLQMRYFMPIFVGFIAYNISGAVGLYWTTSNIFAIAQEFYMRKKYASTKAQIAEKTNNQNINPKSEARNPKQYQNSKHEIQNKELV